jgi:CRISPR-associated protein Csm3
MAGEFFGKVILTGTIELLTGMHIGANTEGLDIGGIDAPVVRDPITRYPYIPGSSLKGKLRTLFERSMKAQEKKDFNRNGGRGIKRHECSDPTCEICRLFGATGQRREDPNQPARLVVRDCRLTEESAERLRQIETGLYMTEWKFENGLDRITAAANPRQLERVPAGAKFHFEFSYTVVNRDDIVEDLRNLVMFVRVLEDDYLGGHGSRGYGQVRFKLDRVQVKNRDVYLGETPVIELPRDTSEFKLSRDELETIAKHFA